MSTATKLDSFTRGYVECALWSSHDYADDSGGEPLDANYGVDDIAPETLEQMTKDCQAFREENKANLDFVEIDDSRAGFLFWLNRNRHGSGFWDEYFGTDQATRKAFTALSDASKAYRSYDLYVGDDGKIYGN